jgi:hypothetical protein
MTGILSYHSAWSRGPQAGQQSLSGSPSQSYSSFASPWDSKDIVHGTVNIQHLFDFAEFLDKFDPTFHQAIRRVIGYFLTDIEFYDPSHKGEVKQEDFNSYTEVLQQQLDIMSVISEVLTDLCVYGNSFIVMLSPIERSLKCPNCGLIQPLDVVASPDNDDFYKFRYHYKGVRCEASCPKCRNRGYWDMSSGKADYRRNVRLVRFSPREFIIEHDPFTDRRVYIWRIPSAITERIKKGDPMILASAPKSVLQAVSEDKMYRFDSSSILHIRESSLAGIPSGGWGIPRAAYGYGPSRYVFCLRRMNEILAEDYLIPMRLISPSKSANAEGTQAFDTGTNVDLFDWNRQLHGIIAAHRRDPAAVHTAGFPVEYQVLGGEGKDLVPGELLVQGEDMQLNAMGIPPEFYRGNLSLQTAPMAARLFEAHWQHVVSAANRMLSWVVGKLTPELGWKACSVRLQPPRIADNMDQLMLMMQLLQTGGVSETTVMRRMGIDKNEEVQKQRDEAAFQAEIQAKQDQEMDKLVSGSTVLQQEVESQRAMQQQAQSGGAAPAGGDAPAGPPPADPVGDIMMKIEQFANPSIPTKMTDQLAVAQEAGAVFANLPEIDKRQKLREVDQMSPLMGDLIRKQMSDFHKQQNAQFAAQGQQAMQQGGSAPPMQ